jgi:hypothetical protein
MNAAPLSRQCRRAAQRAKYKAFLKRYICEEKSEIQKDRNNAHLHYSSMRQLKRAILSSKKRQRRDLARECKNLKKVLPDGCSVNFQRESGS